MRRDLQGPLKIVACIMKEYLAGTRRSADFLDWQAESQALLNAWESSVIPFPTAPKDSTLKTTVVLEPGFDFRDNACSCLCFVELGSFP
jgi:hypothetical protein